MATGSFTVTRPVGGGDVVVTGDPIDIISGLQVLCTEVSPNFVLTLSCESGTIDEASVRISIERFAVRGGIGRHHARVERTASVDTIEVVGFGAEFVIPEGEVSQLDITAVLVSSTLIIE